MKGGQKRRRAGGNKVTRRILVTQSRLFKGHILFEGPHCTLHYTSLDPFCLRAHNTAS